MDQRSNRAGGGGPGMIHKAAALIAHQVTEDDLKAINKYTLEPLTAEEVYTFRLVLCDNELDRDHEHFTLRALQDLQKLFVGKTGIKDHTWSADNQVARIYATELVQDTKTTKQGELYTQLVAHCYMVKTPSNADLIAEIKGGIKKEVSVGCAVASAFCSICGTDNTKSYCRHYPGKTYEKEGGAVLCTFALDGGKDAYEFSFVAVPAQKAAGTSKSYTGETVKDEGQAPAEQQTPGEGEAAPDEVEKAALLALRARMAASKIKTH